MESVEQNVMDWLRELVPEDVLLALQETPPEQLRLLFRMRDAAMNGNTVHLRKNKQTGRLIAHEEVYHDSGDYKSEKRAA